MNSLCRVCHIRPPSRAYGLGDRCAVCAESARATARAERALIDAAERLALQAHVAAGCPDDGLVCESCCDHEFDSSEGFMCLECGAEGLC